MGVDFLVSRAIVGLFCLVVRIVGRENHESHLHSFAGKAKKKLHIRFLLIVYFIFKAHLSSSCFAIRSQVNYTLRSPFNNLHIIRLNISYSLGFNCIILLTCLVLAGYIHSNPGPNSGREKFCHISNILPILENLVIT